MNNAAHTMNEQDAATAFDKQAPFFDALYSGDSIIQYKRKRVRDHVTQLLRPNSNILELNAGTGDDAIFFAQQGHTVHATDISGEMQHLLAEKVKQHDLRNSISHELCSYTDLKNLFDRGPYDLIFSNFAGLNCTNELPKVLQSFDSLLKPDGLATLVILPKFCLWEFLLLFKGKFKTAFRRFPGSKGAKAHIEGEYFRCWYYNPSFIQKHLKENFDMIGLEGLCTVVPPSYLNGFAEKYPKTYQWLIKKENNWKARWPWKKIGDYYIISLKKRKTDTRKSIQF
jgi:ubiquinone/menaquinone biosynthesis C-methylase UbiE